MNEQAESAEEQADVMDAVAAETVEGLRAQLEEARSQAERFQQSWQRTAADFQNYKRRNEEERTNYQRLANTAFAKDLLPIVDDLDRAVSNIDPAAATSPWAEGVRQIQRKFEGLLLSRGIEEVPALGQPFDPNVHEAIGQAPGDEGAVTTVIGKGYAMNGRVIRAAQVLVGNGEPPSADR